MRIHMIDDASIAKYQQKVLRFSTKNRESRALLEHPIRSHFIYLSIVNHFVVLAIKLLIEYLLIE